MFTRTLKSFLRDAPIKTTLYGIFLLMFFGVSLIQFCTIATYSSLIKEGNIAAEDQYMHVTMLNIGASIFIFLLLGYLISQVFKVCVTRKIRAITDTIAHTILRHDHSEGSKEQGDEWHVLIAQIKQIALNEKERCQLSFELIRTRIEAEISNKAKSEFLANMSHELRTPLNAIIGFSEIMACDPLGDGLESHFKEYAHDIHESGVHLLHIINEILDLSNIEAGNVTVIAREIILRNMADKSIALLQGISQEKSISLQNNIPRNLPHFYGDERMIHQIFINVLSNALTFSLDGGIVVIKAEVMADGALCLFICDNGIGIEEGDLEKIGSSFVRLNSAYTKEHEGVGLGLTLVNAYMKLHGGCMRIKSILGLGTTISLIFPAACLLDNVRGDADIEQYNLPTLQMKSL